MRTTRNLLIVAALALCGCAGTPKAQAPAQPRPAERWVVIFTHDAVQALAARPAHPDAPGRIPAVPALDGRIVREQAMRQLRHLYRRYRIEFEAICVAEGVKPHLPKDARYAIVANETQSAAIRGILMGLADGIDPMNRKHQHVTLNWLGALIKVMRFDPERQKTLKGPTSEEVGIALGTLIAHETGHTLGLRHNVVETEEDLSTLMAQGAWKYSIKFLREVRIHYINAVYLDRVLGTVPSAGPVVPKYAHELRRRGTMEAKEIRHEYRFSRGPACARQQGNRLGHRQHRRDPDRHRCHSGHRHLGRPR